MQGEEREREEVVDERQDENDQLRCSREWDQLPEPLLEMIQQRLPIPDYIRFAAVCQWWRQVQHDNFSMSYLRSKAPWLMLFGASCSPAMPIFYDISEGRVYAVRGMNRVLVRNYHVVGSSFGWLLLNRRCGIDRIFLHPISGKRIYLPPCDGKWNRHLVALSSSPSDPNCVIAVPRLEGLFLYRIGETVPWWKIRYHVRSYDSDLICGVAFYDGKFYGLTRGSDIITIDHDTAEIQKFSMDSTQLPECHTSSHKSFLVSRGVFLLLRCNVDKHPNVEMQVFKADFGSKAWVRVWSIGEQQVFVNESGSISVDSSSSCLGGGRGGLVYLCHSYQWHTLQWCLLEHDLKNGTTRYLEDPVRTKQRISLEFTWVSPSLS